MEIEDYIELLKKDKSVSSYIEMDKDKEINYMENHKESFKKIIKSIPIVSKPIRVLDIGPTPFTIFIKNKFQNYDVWALDRTNLLQDRFEQAGIQVKSCDLDNCCIPFQDEYFDLIIFTEVLEHIFAPPTNILKEIKRIMSPCGKLILGVPNIANLSKRVKFLFGITPLANADNQMKKEWVHGHGHIHEYTKKEILTLCDSVNLKILRIEFQSTTPLQLLRMKKKVSLMRFLYCCITFCFPPFRTNIYVECSK